MNRPGGPLASARLIARGPPVDRLPAAGRSAALPGRPRGDRRCKAPRGGCRRSPAKRVPRGSEPEIEQHRAEQHVRGKRRRVRCEDALRIVDVDRDRRLQRDVRQRGRQRQLTRELIVRADDEHGRPRAFHVRRRAHAVRQDQVRACLQQPVERARIGEQRLQIAERDARRQQAAERCELVREHRVQVRVREARVAEAEADVRPQPVLALAEVILEHGRAEPRARRAERVALRVAEIDERQPPLHAREDLVERQPDAAVPAHRQFGRNPRDDLGRDVLAEEMRERERRRVRVADRHRGARIREAADAERRRRRRHGRRAPRRQHVVPTDADHVAVVALQLLEQRRALRLRQIGQPLRVDRMQFVRHPVVAHAGDEARRRAGGRAARRAACVAAVGHACAVVARGRRRRAARRRPAGRVGEADAVVAVGAHAPRGVGHRRDALAERDPFFGELARRRRVRIRGGRRRRGLRSRRRGGSVARVARRGATRVARHRPPRARVEAGRVAARKEADAVRAVAPSGRAAVLRMRRPRAREQRRAEPAGHRSAPVAARTSTTMLVTHYAPAVTRAYRISAAGSDTTVRTAIRAACASRARCPP
ncbi:hypothetical protein BURPS1710b_A0287 [Burkholderia pseudomallei 1710b]|uniref:Uncharacterized protein n=1 Tax=Burkholderia pseudomallei (strain 1710b) TaxID=320372 RepID=Q3JLV7_BURP1|nr:hypothetical protein BURPS1710b_A0287 [Burkholderia pseudomallei 1710b]